MELQNTQPNKEKVVKKLAFNESFRVEDSELEFRFIKAKPTLILSLSAQLFGNKSKLSEEFYETILDWVEVKIEDQWIKMKQGELYFPTYLEENILVLNELVMKFLNEILIPSFMKSTQSIKD